jgi:peptidoglycan/xylan/chitin deacetylase (PgdA/CDA1 family)
MLEATQRIGLFDRYRVPYRVREASGEGIVVITAAGADGPKLLSLASARRDPRHYVLNGGALYVDLADEADVGAALAATGAEWVEELPILDQAGGRRGAVLRAADGSLFLPFDLDDALDNLLGERYQEDGSHLRALASRGYNVARPLMPRQMQLALRRRFRLIQDRTTFPSWPVETALHRLEALVLALVERIAGAPLPWIAPWPAPYGWALVLTHDVEQAGGYANVRAVRTVEAEQGLRSAWYFVPYRDYVVEPSLLDELRVEGCEIGLHGLRHDGRDLAPGTFPARVEEMKSVAREWGARGFRSPSTYRDRELVQQLGFEHDSSWSDVARYEPQPGGCCSWLPFFIGTSLVELPITLAQDLVLFELRRENSEEPWIAKTRFLREHGGMALLLTHPDYLTSPHRIGAYERFVAEQARDATAWHALPHEVATWWRQRAESGLERAAQDDWRVVGPAAASAQVCLGAPAPPPARADLRV